MGARDWAQGVLASAQRQLAVVWLRGGQYSLELGTCPALPAANPHLAWAHKV